MATFEIWRRPFRKRIATAETAEEAEQTVLDYEVWAQEEGLTYKFWAERVEQEDR